MHIQAQRLYAYMGETNSTWGTRDKAKNEKQKRRLDSSNRRIKRTMRCERRQPASQNIKKNANNEENYYDVMMAHNN